VRQAIAVYLERGASEWPAISVSMQFDGNSWLTGVFVNGNQVNAYTRDNDGLITVSGPLQITRDLPSGDVAATQLGSLTTSESTSRFGEQSSYACSFDSSALYSESTGQRDLAGRIVDRTETVQGTARAYHYAYDHAGRLTDVSVDGNFRSHYAYDPNGNRTSLDTPGDTTSATYDAQDRIVTYGSLHYAYSAVGALNSKTDATTGRVTRYDCDAFGNLRNVQLPDGRQIQYTMDPFNRRIGKAINGVRSFGLLYAS
jgi:YD repeat-containing protein